MLHKNLLMVQFPLGCFIRDKGDPFILRSRKRGKTFLGEHFFFFNVDASIIIMTHDLMIVVKDKEYPLKCI